MLERHMLFATLMRHFSPLRLRARYAVADVTLLDADTLI